MSSHNRTFPSLLPQTAFFEVPANAVHGEELVCSHPICRHGGIKFLLCKYCDEPVAKRSFRLNHSHKELQDAEKKNSSTKKRNSGRPTDDDEEFRAQKRQKVKVVRPAVAGGNVLSAPLDTLAAAAAGVQMPHSVGEEGVDSFHMNSGYSDTSSFSASTEHRPSDGGDPNNSSTDEDQNEDNTIVQVKPGNDTSNAKQLKSEWCDLLEARRTVESADDMSGWLMRVFSISQRCVSTRNHNVSDDDDINNSSDATNDGKQLHGLSIESGITDSTETRKESSADSDEVHE